MKLQELDKDGNPVESTAPAPRASASPRPAVTPRVAADGVDQYVTVDGAGDQSGKDWANARPAAGLQAALNAAGPGNTVHVGSGTYPAAALTFASGGGREGAVKTLAGQDTGGGLPVFNGAWTKDNPAKSGGVFVTVPPGVSHVAIRDLKLSNVRTGLSLKGPNSHIAIENVDITESRDALWVQGAATAGDEASYSQHITIKDCDINFYTKRALRIFDGVRNVQVSNCRADAGGKDWFVEPFPIGFQVIGGENGVVDSDITFTDCVAAGNYHDPGPDKSYWNADGFCSESAVRNLSYIRCSAFNNTDGGWDVKAPGVKMVDCVAIGNKRNFRIWLKPGEGAAVLDNCLSAYSVNFGEKNHDVGFWFLNTGDVTMTRCTAYGDRVAMKVEGKEARQAVVTLDRCALIPAEAGTARNLHEGVELKDTATVTEGQVNAPSRDWRGGNDAFNLKSGPGVGYEFRVPTAQRP